MQTCASTRAAVDIRRCRNVDEQALLLDAWNQTYCQISRGPFDGSVSSFVAGGIRVLIERLNRTVYQRGAVAPGRIAIGVPFQLEGHALLCGQPSHRDGLHVFSGDGGFEFLSPDRHVVVNLEIEPNAMASLLAREQIESIEARLGAHATVLNIDPVQLQTYRATLRTMLDAVTLQPALLDDAGAVDSFERHAIFGLAEMLAATPDDTPARSASPAAARISRHWQLVRAVRDVVEESPDCPLSVAELCARFHASRRTLQYAFEETLGVNPSAYIRAVRLGRVRRELRGARSVTEVATRWGFWHFGNFSGEYREQFGELPSETFRRENRC